MDHQLPGAATGLPLVPLPRLVGRSAGTATLRPGTPVQAPADRALAPVLARLETRLREALGPVGDGARPSDAVADGARVVLALVASAADLDPDLAGLGEELAAEAYTLTVEPHEVRLTAVTPAGLRHASTTLLALVEHAARTAAAGGALTLPPVRICDAPQHVWRGLMVDVARRFRTVEEVLTVAEVMADLKLNRLHLHLTDDQGWRYEVPGRPELTEISGRTAVAQGPAGWFTEAELHHLVAAAADLGIEVVPEVDLPGHMNAALHALADLNADGRPAAARTDFEVGYSRLRGDLPATAPFVADALTAAAAYAAGHLHIGGDEAGERDPGYATVVSAALDVVTGLGRTPVVWQEAAVLPLPAGTVVQLWDERQPLAPLLAAAQVGCRVLVSPGSRAYLDQKYDADFPLGLTWAGLVSLERSYDWDPAALVPGLPQGALLGVEACLWSETTATMADYAALLLPRLAAVAEVAWSPVEVRSWPAFRSRVAQVAPAWTARGLAWTRTSDGAW